MLLIYYKGNKKILKKAHRQKDPGQRTGIALKLSIGKNHLILIKPNAPFFSSLESARH